jgi:hypothetical protein
MGASEMPSTIKLIDIVRLIERQDGATTICVTEPWTPESPAIAATEPGDGSIPPEAQELGARYFLETFLAKEFIERWLINLGHTPPIKEVCMRLIQYARTDA